MHYHDCGGLQKLRAPAAVTVLLAVFQLAEHKARTAVRFRRETKLLEDAIQKFAYVSTLDDVIASRGGIPLVVDGKIVGGLGCSGGAGSQDEAVCKFGAAQLGK